jgi:hypothetical protein
VAAVTSADVINISIVVDARQPVEPGEGALRCTARQNLTYLLTADARSAAAKSLTITPGGSPSRNVLARSVDGSRTKSGTRKLASKQTLTVLRRASGE